MFLSGLYDWEQVKKGIIYNKVRVYNKVYGKEIVDKKHKLLIQVSQVQKLMKLKELSLPTVAEELRQ